MSAHHDMELLSFNAQKFQGSRDPGHAPFSKKILRVMSGLFLETFEVCDGVVTARHSEGPP